MNCIDVCFASTLEQPLSLQVSVRVPYGKATFIPAALLLKPVQIFCYSMNAALEETWRVLSIRRHITSWARQQSVFNAR
jgi:hypothetical protein